jgi:hypothetical protein
MNKILSCMAFLLLLFMFSTCSKEKDGEDIFDHTDELQTKIPADWEVEETNLSIISNIPINISQAPSKIIIFVNTKLSCSDTTGSYHPRFEIFLLAKDYKTQVMTEVQASAVYSDCERPQYYGESEKYIILLSSCRSYLTCNSSEVENAFGELKEALKAYIK